MPTPAVEAPAFEVPASMGRRDLEVLAMGSL